ncbi:MAG: hypothetical protein K2G69_00070, partial [Muribaculaceae bacterium]|nr:hypothetical protein [Muribaculaceae bacterium]
MIIQDKIYRKAGNLVGIMAAAMLWGCSADNFNAPDSPDYGEFGDAQLIINLAVPQGEMVSDTRATQAAETDELGINDLRLYIFSNTGDNATPVKKMKLQNPGRLKTNANHTVDYAIDGLEKDGTYYIYLFANLGDVDSDFATFKEMKDKVIDYTQTAHNLVAGNLPMMYEPTAGITLGDDSNNPVTVPVTLDYACVKVRYNIIFDKTNADCKSAFGDNGLMPTGLTLSNVTKTAKVFANTTVSYYEADGNSVGKSLAGYDFYTAYSENSNAETTGADKISVSGSKLTADDIKGEDVWVLRGTTYIPERHVASNTNQTTLSIVSKVNGETNGLTANHSKVLGKTAEQYKKLERGNYYEFIGRIRNTGIDGIDWEVNVKDWEPMTIDADFIHTYLTLDKTETFISTEENGVITYQTDGRGGVKFECGPDAMRNGKPLFEPAPMAAADGINKLVLRINSNVQVEPDTKITNNNPEGDDCWIIAGNIKKHIKVKYNIEGFFE